MAFLEKIDEEAAAPDANFEISKASRSKLPTPGRVWCSATTLNNFRVFRRHAALLVVALEELCLLLSPCLATKAIGTMFKPVAEHHTDRIRFEGSISALGFPRAPPLQGAIVARARQ